MINSPSGLKTTNFTSPLKLNKLRYSEDIYYVYELFDGFQFLSYDSSRIF